MNLISKLILSVLLTFTLQLTFAQHKITGEVLDQTEKTKLAQATITLLQAQDSILISFTRADENGKFSLAYPDQTDYLLLISYPKFGEFFKEIKKGSADLDLGKVELQSAAHLIEEVLITGKIPVVIKGDTVEYDAGSFVTEKNANVEDLLKVLPGISVDATGKITAQGKTVEKVLVDGEEFFGNDPKLVTRNIRSDMVDKVQVYEKKSEQTERTGVDDGTRVQTINVKLKEDAKKGMFGKVEAAGGLDDNSEYYLGKVAFNKFNGSQKIGAFILGSNDGNVSLNWEEEEKFGVGSSISMEDDGMVYRFGGGDEFSYWNGKGQPKAITGGISFLDQWKEKKHKLNLNYKYGNIENNIIESNINQTPRGAGLLNSNTDNRSYSDALRHQFNTKYDYALDSLTTLTLKVGASKSNTERNNTINGESMFDDVKESENFSQQNSIINNQNISYDTYFTKKFKREGRSISLRFAGNNSQDQTDLTLKSELKDASNTIIEEIDQFKDITSTSDNIQTSLSYSEPLSKKIMAVFGYDFNLSKSHSINKSFNKDDQGNYTVLDEVFSNDFNFNTNRNAANIGIGYKNDKMEVKLTNILRFDDMNQKNNFEGTTLQRDYITYNPSMRFRYNISKSKMIGFNYNLSNNLPSLFQIQPLRQNTDQMNQTFGNENLKPSRSSNYSINYHTYDMLKGKFIYLGSGFTQNFDAIQQNLVLLPGGKRELYYDNVDIQGNSGYIYAGGGFDLIRKYQIKSEIRLNGNLSNYGNYIWDKTTVEQDQKGYVKNLNNNYNYNVSFELNRNTTKGVDFSISFNPGWNIMKTSLNPERNSDGFTYRTDFNYRVYLPLKITLFGDLGYQYEAPTKAFAEKFERVLFKPGISKKFLKGDNLMVDFTVSDLFNQNKGFRRFQSGNSISQNTYNTIARYYMLKFTWDLTYMKGGQ